MKSRFIESITTWERKPYKSLVLRFANSFINSQWDNTCIDHVQITVGEMVGIEGRWTYYDKVGQLRDMVQNHLMQLMLVHGATELIKSESIRDEKVKIVRALRRIDSQSVNEKWFEAVHQRLDSGYSGARLPRRGRV